MKRYGLLTALFVMSLPLSATQVPLPNIIYILADDLGYGDLGSYGQEKIQTPHLDKIAREGMRFTQHYSAQAVCAPARCSLLTGLHQGHAFIRNNKELPTEGQTPIPADSFTIAKMLKTKGYATACVGKWGLGYPGSEGDPNNQGFDLFFGNNCQRHAHQFYRNYLWKNDQKVMYLENKDIEGPHYSADEMRKEALQFMDDNRDGPFFLYYATPIPHVSLQVPDESLAQYEGRWPEKPFKGRYNAKSGKGYTGHATPRAAYAAMVSHMDRNIGMLMAKLDELGLAENTIVLFASDNGATYAGGADPKFFNGAPNMRGLKGSLYEGGIRVPFIARWPGKIAPDSTSEHISAFWDILPTLAEITGADIPVEVDGISLLPTLTGQGEQQQHEALYWEFNAPHYNGGQIAVRMGDWKAIKVNQVSRGKGKNKQAGPFPGELQLYNLAEDLGETMDLAAEYPELVERIEAIIRREHTRSELFPLKSLDG